MVFAFLCHSVSGTPCRILYSAVYGDDMQNALNQVISASRSIIMIFTIAPPTYSFQGTPAENLREIRKEQLMQASFFPYANRFLMNVPDCCITVRWLVASKLNMVSE